MTATGRRTERAWLILVLATRRCSGPDMCAWMRQRRQSKLGDDDAALRLSPGCESMQQKLNALRINEASFISAEGNAWKMQFYFVVNVVLGLTVMDGSKKKDIQKTEKRKWTSENLPNKS